MSRSPRAVVFDLDNTLYPYRRFLRSGFAAVAAHLEHAHGVNGRWAFRWLLRASRGDERGRELQACLAVLQLSPCLVPVLLQVLRDHAPTMQLPRASMRMLDRLRADDWRLGVLTNGSPVVQARKVAALGVAGRVDAVVYASEHGNGKGKPEPEPFVEVARRLQVAPARIVFVGDDGRCDVLGANLAGMHPLRCAAWVPAGAGEIPTVPVVDRLSSVPTMASVLLEEPSGRHAA
jgi:putative hydrolase of the HAD superfamily